MPATALQHFNEDIARARAILAHADPLGRGRTRPSCCFAPTCCVAPGCSPLARWSLLLRCLYGHRRGHSQLKSRQPAITLPDWAYDIKVPIRAVLEDYDKANWRWRMAARRMMERENVISLSAITTLFNKFFRKGHGSSGICSTPGCLGRMRGFAFSAPSADYMTMNNTDKHAAREVAIDQFEDRFKMIFQRRHDCIHNCDRPRVSPQQLNKGGIVLKVIQDVDYLVQRCDEHFNSRVPRVSHRGRMPPRHDRAGGLLSKGAFVHLTI